MGNVNWIINDPVSQYMSGVFLELWKTPTDHYPSADASKDNASNVRSIEAMEVILNYWNENLMSPKIIEQLAPKGVLRVAINLSNFPVPST